MGEIKGWLMPFFAVFASPLDKPVYSSNSSYPSPSMVSTMNVGDRVFVSKTIYGIEVYPGAPNILSKNRQVQRDDIITFYNPEYDSKGPFFDILSQVLYMGTFSLVNIDKNDDGSVAERLYVKRAIGFPGEVVRFSEGNAEIRKAGSVDFVPKRASAMIWTWWWGPHRSVSPSD